MRKNNQHFEDCIFRPTTALYDETALLIYLLFTYFIYSKWWAGRAWSSADRAGPGIEKVGRKWAGPN